MDTIIALTNYTKENAFDPKYISAYESLAKILNIIGKIIEVEQTTLSAVKLAESAKNQAISKYSLAVSLKIQGKRTAILMRNWSNFTLRSL